MLSRSLGVGCALLLGASFSPAAHQDQPAEPQTHHVFIDKQFIWTFEMVRNGDQNVPVLNIITLTQGEWMLRPQQVRIYNSDGKRARVKSFSMETGTTPVIRPFFRVLGNSFIGVDLAGEFTDFEKPVKVEIDLGDYRYQLEPVDPLGFENLAIKLNRVNYDSPDVREDYAVLNIEHIGTRKFLTRRER